MTQYYQNLAVTLFLGTNTGSFERHLEHHDIVQLVSAGALRLLPRIFPEDSQLIQKALHNLFKRLHLQT